MKMIILKSGKVELRWALTVLVRGELTDAALPERSGRMARALKILIPLDALWTTSKSLLSENIPNCRERSFSRC